jgi:RimJ/RimL family protein N-acetyltransferase
VPDVSIRAATGDDVDAVLDVLEAVGEEGRWLGIEAPFDRAARGERMHNELAQPAAHGAFVAEGPDAAGKVIGFITVHLAPYGVASIGMAILDGYRGQGIGTCLMERAAAWAVDAGAHKLALEVWPHNERAIALYTKLGFTEEGRLRRHYRRRNGELWDAVIMGRHLGAP